MKALRVAAVAVLLVAGMAGGAYLMREEIAGWLLRGRLGSELSRLTGAKVEIHGASYHGGVLKVERCRVTGEALPFAMLEIVDARLPVGWQRLKNPAGDPLQIEASAVDLVWRDNPREEAKAPSVAGSSIPLPVVNMSAARFSFRHEDDARWRIRDCEAAATVDAGAWKFSGRGGTFGAAGWQELRVERITGEHCAGETRVDEFVLNKTEGGQISGSARGRQGEWSGEFRWSDIGMDLVLPPAATEHFHGRSSGEARLAGGVLTGKMRLDGSEVRKLPALVKLASIFTGEDYSTVALETARFDFMRDQRGAVLITNLAAASPDGLAVQGSGAFAPDYLSADLQLGLKREGRPWLVAFMPVLFRTEKDGYLWTPVKVAGTPQSPTEDLTPRVVAALATAPATQAVESAVELPASAVEAAGGLLRGLLGR